MKIKRPIPWQRAAFTNRWLLVAVTMPRASPVPKMETLRVLQATVVRSCSTRGDTVSGTTDAASSNAVARARSVGDDLRARISRSASRHVWQTTMFLPQRNTASFALVATRSCSAGMLKNAASPRNRDGVYSQTQLPNRKHQSISKSRQTQP
jgi:hypothetical protein